MNNFYHLIVKESFWDQLIDEIKDIFDMFGDFFQMIKEVTYDVVANAIGGDMAILIVIAVGVIGVMLVCLAIINR